MNCQEINSQLTRYLLNELNQTQMDTIKVHLENCQSCQTELKLLEPTLALLTEALETPAITQPRLELSRRQKILFPKKNHRVISWISEPHPRLAIAAGLVFVVGLLWGVSFSAKNIVSVKASRQSQSIMPLEFCVDASEALDQPASAERTLHAGVRLNIAEPEPMEELEDIEISFVEATTVNAPPPCPLPLSCPKPIVQGQETTFQSTDFDTVAMVKSPIIMKGIHGSRSPGSRGAKTSFAGGGVRDESGWGSGSGEASIDTTGTGPDYFSDTDGDGLLNDFEAMGVDGKTVLQDGLEIGNIRPRDQMYSADEKDEHEENVPILGGTPILGRQSRNESSKKPASESPQLSGTKGGKLGATSGKPNPIALGSSFYSGLVTEDKGNFKASKFLNPKGDTVVIVEKALAGERNDRLRKKKIATKPMPPKASAEFKEVSKSEVVALGLDDDLLGDAVDNRDELVAIENELGKLVEKINKAEDNAVEFQRLHDISRVEARGSVEPRYIEALAKRRSQLKNELMMMESSYPTLNSDASVISAVSKLTQETGSIKPDAEELKRRDLQKALRIQLNAIESAEYKWKSNNQITSQREAEYKRLQGEVKDSEAKYQVLYKKLHDARVTEELRKAESKSNIKYMSEEAEKTARFKAFGVNPFVKVSDQAFSTFAIDVDTAAYTLGRNYLQRGELPPAESVRTEEYVNFFDYAYKAPVHKTFEVYSEVAPSKFGHGLNLLKIGVKGRRLGREEQRQAVLTFLIDTSGSMNQSDRLDLVQTSLELLVNELNPNDLVAIVQYDSHARLLLEHTPASNKAVIMQAIKRLQCSGSTNLEEGMHKAYAQAAANFVAKGENRVLLLSDGVANLGSGAAEDILAKVSEYRTQGITCSVFGFGMGAYDDSMLETLANNGDGAYSFIDSKQEAQRVFVDDLSATLNTIASDVKIQVEYNPAYVAKYRQLGYENRQLKKQDFRNDSVDAGEIGSGQSVTALYELDLNVPQDNTGARAHRLQKENVIATVRVRYRRIDTGAVEEIEHRVLQSDLLNSFDKASPRFKLAAAVAEFSEILRVSPFAEGSTMEDVAKVLRPVALDLNLDSSVQELLRMAK